MSVSIKKTESDKRYIASHPWARSYWGARSRCVYKTGNYYGRVKFFMTLEDFKTLWFRDKAWLLTIPSIDRIDPEKDYVYENCRYLEMRENARRARNDMRIETCKRNYKEGINRGLRKGDVAWNKGRTGLQVAWNKGMKMPQEYIDIIKTRKRDKNGRFANETRTQA